MGETIRDAGELREKVRVLACVPVNQEATDWKWQEVRKAYAKAESTRRMAIFANTGVGTREVVFTLRRQHLRLGDVICWKDRYHFITSAAPLGVGYLTVTTAEVEICPCKGVERNTEREIKFPAVVTEKFMGHSQEEPMAQNAVRLVLVVPKPIRLKLGSLVELPDAPYWVKVPHELDPDKTEYEVERTVEP